MYGLCVTVGPEKLWVGIGVSCVFCMSFACFGVYMTSLGRVGRVRAVEHKWGACSS